jgi:phytoene dehydrogenase-like protein
VFAQYVPYGMDWDARRHEAGRLAVAAIAAHTTNIPDAIAHVEVMGPPDIEKNVGLTGGHIFQGEMLPDYMWDRRLESTIPNADSLASREAP